MTRKWLSPPPTRCETCDSPIHDKFYDAKTKHGPWACMCRTCHVLGPGINRLGQGYGQEYTHIAGEWVKTAG